MLAHWARATPLKHDTSPAAVERPTSSPTSLSRCRNHYLDSLSCSSLPHLPIKCQTEPPRRPNPAAPPPSTPTSTVRCRSAAPDFPQPPRPSSKLCLHPVKLLGLFPLPICHQSDLVAIQPLPPLPASTDKPLRSPPPAPKHTKRCAMASSTSLTPWPSPSATDLARIGRSTHPCPFDSDQGLDFKHCNLSQGLYCKKLFFLLFFLQ